MKPTGRMKLAMLYAGLAVATAACHGPSTAAGGGQMFTDDHGLLRVPANSPLRSHLEVEAIGPGAAAGTMELPAAVEADPARVVNILAPLTGRVVALKVSLGEHVRRGQVLAVLASGDYAQAKSDDVKARDAFDLARKALDRTREVQQAGGQAAKDLEAAQSGYNQAQAELTRAHDRLLSLGGGGSHDLTLTAPQNGVVTALALAAGAQVSDPTATLMTVTNLDRVYVTANVPEDQIRNIAPGSEADIALIAASGRLLHGRISEADAVVQPDTRRQKVRIALANGDGRLMPNMYATVRLVAPSAGGVDVPQSALIMNNDSITVLVEVSPWVFQRRAVKIGDETDTSAHVLSGLAAGDRVVVRGAVLLND
jgi:cobalt-zinc-cadmium efflux system membrane fusion protein